MRKYIIVYLSILFLSCLSSQVRNQSNPEIPIIIEQSPQEYILTQINNLRSKGCKCKGKYLKPVKTLSWNDLLYKSAYKHAKSMFEDDYFSHYSPDGKDIGDRLDEVGYKWQFAGENLAEGQKNFEEAMHDWVVSPTHCLMLMNPDMEEVAVAKYKTYWVQHFGKRMPKNAKRVGRKTSTGD